MSRIFALQVIGEARLHQAMTVVVEFTNPLNEWLRNCSLTIIGRGFFKSDHIVGSVRGCKSTHSYKDNIFLILVAFL